MQWTNVNDKLPPKIGAYIVFNGATVFSANFVGYPAPDYRPIANDNNGFDWPCDITHWMRFPDPTGTHKRVTRKEKRMISGHEIHQEWINGNISIHPYNPANIQPNSYDLTLGNELKICIPNRQQYIDTDLPGDGQTIDLVDGHFVIYPGEVYIGHTVESVGSHLYAPMLHGRSSVARHGLAVHITAGFGDVGWYGQFVLEIVNHNSCPILIRPGRRICQVSWEPVTGKLHDYESAYQNQQGARLSKGIV